MYANKATSFDYDFVLLYYCTYQHFALAEI